MSIRQNILNIRRNLPSGVSLICVSKYHTVQEILEAYEAGERDFGESRAQELEQKAKVLPNDIRWHFIGHLQRNKVKQVCKYACMIQSVDSERLLRCIDQNATPLTDLLLEVHIAKEDTKTGLQPHELFSLLQNIGRTPLKNTRICGLMGMASQTDDNKQIALEFASLHSLFDKVKTEYFPDDNSFATLSMGMSDDYPIAIAQGATMIRTGSLIFAQDE